MQYFTIKEFIVAMYSSRGSNDVHLSVLTKVRNIYCGYTEINDVNDTVDEDYALNV